MTELSKYPHFSFDINGNFSLEFDTRSAVLPHLCDSEDLEKEDYKMQHYTAVVIYFDDSWDSRLVT